VAARFPLRGLLLFVFCGLVALWSGLQGAYFLARDLLAGKYQNDWGAFREGVVFVVVMLSIGLGLGAWLFVAIREAVRTAEALEATVECGRCRAVYPATTRICPTCNTLLG
jgi:hypothetical protein